MALFPGTYGVRPQTCGSVLGVGEGKGQRLHQGCVFSFQELQSESDGFLSFLLCREKISKMLQCVCRVSNSAVPLHRWRQSVFPGMALWVNFNPLKCQKPHLLLHLKWEYFAPFFFFHLDLVFQCLCYSLHPRCQQQGKCAVIRGISMR